MEWQKEGAKKEQDGSEHEKQAEGGARREGSSVSAGRKQPGWALPGAGGREAGAEGQGSRTPQPSAPRGARCVEAPLRGHFSTCVPCKHAK